NVSHRTVTISAIPAMTARVFSTQSSLGSLDSLNRGNNSVYPMALHGQGSATLMKTLLHAFTGHPYLVLTLSGLLERTGFPLLLPPVRGGAGALAATGQMRFDLALWLALAACVAGDTLWFELGRKKGNSVLTTLCRISLEPDSCVRRSKNFFEKGAART